MTFISRIFGFIRDVVLARTFGANIYTDAFFVAFRLPNLLRRFFAEGAFSQAFIPILGEYKNSRSKEETQKLVSKVATTLSVVLLVVCCIAIFIAPVVIYLSAPGFVSSQTKFEVAVVMFRICFPYILFVSLTALAGGILNVWGKFAAPAISPALLNLSLIVFAIWIAPLFDTPVIALAWGVLVGGILQLSLQIPFLIKLGFIPKFDWNPKDKGVKKIFKLMSPMLFGASVAQISLLINTIFASFLVSGSISWLYYADRLMELPVGLLGAALATSLLPKLTENYSQSNPISYAQTIDAGIRMAIVLGAPCAVAMGILGLPIVATLFMYGEFTRQDLIMTQRALFAYSFGIVALVLVRVLATAFFGRQDTKTPVKIAVFTLVATQIMNLIFIWQLGHAGLALAIAIAAWINVCLLFYNLLKYKLFMPQLGWTKFICQTASALLLMCGTIVILKPNTIFWIESAATDRIVQLGILIFCGAISYFFCLWAVGMRPKDFGVMSKINF